MEEEGYSWKVPRIPFPAVHIAAYTRAPMRTASGMTPAAEGLDEATAFAALYESGLSTREIGELAGCSHQTVRRRLSASGVSCRERDAANDAKASAMHLALEAYKREHGLLDAKGVARTAGCASVAVSRLRRDGRIDGFVYAGPWRGRHPWLYTSDTPARVAAILGRRLSPPKRTASGMTPAATVSLDDAAALAELYESGLSTREIAELAGCSHQTVRRRLSAYGVPRRERAAASMAKFSIIRLDFEEYKRVHSLLDANDVARAAGCHSVTVGKLRRAGEIDGIVYAGPWRGPTSPWLYTSDTPARVSAILWRHAEQLAGKRAVACRERWAARKAKGEQYGKPRRGVTKPCPNCGRSTYLHPGHADRPGFCGRRCWGLYRFRRQLHLGFVEGRERWWGPRARKKWEPIWTFVRTAALGGASKGEAAAKKTIKTAIQLVA